MAKEKAPGELSRAARTLGHEGGKAGGPARARKLTDVQLREIAKKGGLAKARKAKRQVKD